MKTGIHPNFNTQVKVTCACGNTFVTGSTLNNISVDLCSNCHPFFTGTQKLIDTEGRVEKFAKRQEAAKTTYVSKKMKDEEKKKKAEESRHAPKTLKEMLNTNN